MAMVAPLITQMVVDGFINRPQPSVPLRKTDVVLAGFALFGLAAAAVCALMAFYFYMRGIALAPPVAALATAGLALAVSLAAVGTLALLRRARRVKVSKRAAAQLPAGLDAALDAAGEALEDIVAENPATSTALAGLAGFLAAEKMH